MLPIVCFSTGDLYMFKPSLRLLRPQRAPFGEYLQFQARLISVMWYMWVNGNSLVLVVQVFWDGVWGMIGDSVTDSLTSFLRSSLPIMWKIFGKSLDLVWSENAPLTELSIWLLLLSQSSSSSVMVLLLLSKPKLHFKYFFLREL